jgi:hypothetical protein
MNAYQTEQLETLTLIRRQIESMGADGREILFAEIKDYLLFREQVANFLEAHFADICTQKCYQSRLSACCSKDGIITFFADMVVNTLASNMVSGTSWSMSSAIRNLIINASTCRKPDVCGKSSRSSVNFFCAIRLKKMPLRTIRKCVHNGNYWKAQKKYTPGPTGRFSLNLWNGFSWIKGAIRR